MASAWLRRNSGLVVMALLVALSTSYLACGSPERQFGADGVGGQPYDGGDDAPSSNK